MTSHAFELVVFDCDGVLVDSEVIAVRVDQLVLADLGWELELDEIVERFVGRSEAHFIATVEEQLGVELGEGWDRKYEPWYRTAFERELVAVDGVVEALDGLRLPHCAASSGSHAKMRRTLGRPGCWHRFEGRIFSATEVAHGKPAPDLFLHAAGTLGTAPERCAVVEDSAHGVQAATVRRDARLRLRRRRDPGGAAGRSTGVPRHAPCFGDVPWELPGSRSAPGARLT